MILRVIAVCTLRCGGEGCHDLEDFGEARHDWFKTFLELPGGIPSHDTFNRLFQVLEPESFLECFVRWTQSLRAAVSEEIVALNGKALRRLALNLFQRKPTQQRGLKGQQKNAGWDHSHLLKLLGLPIQLRRCVASPNCLIAK